MTTTRNTSAARAVALVLSLVAVAAPACAADSAATPTSPTTGCAGPYGWPVKPFDRAHPIRGTFGDPRTVFHGPLTPETVGSGGGVFSFHQGLDISAPDGSPVYAVANGRVTRARGGRVTVDCGNGRSFQYWHIEPAARMGQRAVAGKTVLGFIQPKREHVHLTHLERGQAVNPLMPGRITPYRDTTTPRVLSITARRSAAGQLRFAVNAVDMPSLPVPGRWRGFPITPALVAWRIEDTAGRVVVGVRIARDVRRTLPRNDRFWETFARGTHQNWPVFEGRKERGLTGRYVFRVPSHRIDAHTLRDCGHVLVVTVEDTAGNRDVKRLAFQLDGL